MRGDTDSLMGQVQTHAPQQIASLCDYLVRAGKQRWRDTDVQGVSRLYTNLQLEFCRLLDGKVGRLRAFDDLIYIGCASLEQIEEVGAIPHQRSHLDGTAITDDRR